MVYLPGSILHTCHLLILLDSALQKKATSAALLPLVEGFRLGIRGLRCQITWNTFRYVFQVLAHHYTLLTFSQGTASMNSSTSSLGISVPGKYSRVCYGYHANLTEINMPPTRALPTILKLRMAIIHFEMPHS